MQAYLTRMAPSADGSGSRCRDLKQAPSVTHVPTERAASMGKVAVAEAFSASWGSQTALELWLEESGEVADGGKKVTVPQRHVRPKKA